MTHLDDQGRPEAPIDAGEVESILGFLDFQRSTLAWKCAGVDAAGLQATVPTSAMTLGGLLTHMAFVEDHWFSGSLHANGRSEPWNTVNWREEPDRDWRWADGKTPDELFAMWDAAVVRSRALVAEALAEGGIDVLAQRKWPNGRAPSLRWILLHMIEEYARHNGHADILREAVDGAVGE